MQVQCLVLSGFAGAYFVVNNFNREDVRGLSSGETYLRRKPRAYDVSESVELWIILLIIVQHSRERLLVLKVTWHVQFIITRG